MKDQARIDAMAAQYRAGATMQSIGDEHGVSRQRVGKILEGVVTEAESKKARAKLPRAAEVIVKDRAKHQPAFAAKYGIKRGAK